MAKAVMVKEKDGPLAVPDIEGIRAELGLSDPRALVAKAVEIVDPALEKQADEFVARLLTLDPKDVRAREAGRDSVERAGEKISAQGEKRASAMLEEPLRVLEVLEKGGDPVARDLVALDQHLKQIDPNRWNFAPEWWQRWVLNPVHRYFTQYQAIGRMIMSILRSLEIGRDRLIRDNQIYIDDLEYAGGLTKKLERLSQVLHLADRKLEAKLVGEIPETDERYRFVQEELLFPLRQRLQDIITELAIQQQDVMTTEFLRRINRELIRGVDRIKRVTITALQTAVKAAAGLAHQQIVIEGIAATMATTEHYMRGTAERLRQHGAETYRRATEPAIGVDTLKATFADVFAALDEYRRFRVDALPVMAQNVRVLEELTGEARKRIERLERGDKVQPAIVIDVEAT